MAFKWNNITAPKINFSAKDINTTAAPSQSERTKNFYSRFTDYMNKVNNAKYTPDANTIAAQNRYNSLVDQIGAMKFSESDKTKNTYNAYQNALNAYRNMSFNESDRTKNAYDAFMQGQSQKPGEFKYDDSALKAVYDKIMNRDEFNFDLNSSALYNQYKDQFRTSGQMAMMDTMGRAAALSGGYGSSYAASAGQRAYQQNLQNLADIVPQLYQRALNTYQAEGQQLLDRYGVASGERANAYNRYQDSVNNWLNGQQLNLSAFSTLYGMDMDKYQTALSQAGNVAQMLQGDYNNSWSQDFDIYNSDYQRLSGLANLAQGDYRFGREFGYKRFSDTVNNYLRAANTYGGLFSDSNTMDYNIWNANNQNILEKARFDLDAQKTNASNALETAKINQSGGIAADGSELDWSKLAQDAARFDATMAYNKDRDAADRGLEAERLKQNNEQFWAKYQQDDRRFNDNLDYNKNRDNDANALAAAELVQQNRQFNDELDYTKERDNADREVEKDKVELAGVQGILDGFVNGIVNWANGGSTNSTTGSTNPIEMSDKQSSIISSLDGVQPSGYTPSVKRYEKEIDTYLRAHGLKIQNNNYPSADGMTYAFKTVADLLQKGKLSKPEAARILNDVMG